MAKNCFVESVSGGRDAEGRHQLARRGRGVQEEGQSRGAVEKYFFWLLKEEKQLSPKCWSQSYNRCIYNYSTGVVVC
jgi:hypothetical protein